MQNIITDVRDFADQKISGDSMFGSEHHFCPTKPGMPRNWQHRASCRTCGYPLRDLAGRICPESGRDFEPHDPRTMLLKGWLNRIDHVLLSPPGWVSHGLSLIVMVVCCTPLVHSRYAAGPEVVCSVVLWVPLMGWWFIRVIAWLCLRDYYGEAYGRRRALWHWLVDPAMCVATVLMLTFVR